MGPPHQNDQDQVDTEELYGTNITRIVHESIDLNPGEHGEIVLIPDEDLHFPTLYCSAYKSHDRMIVEEIIHGQAVLYNGPWPISSLKTGVKLVVTVTKNEPIKVLVRNNTMTCIITAHASLVVRTPKLKGE
jgi:hypothetical protein